MIQVTHEKKLLLDGEDTGLRVLQCIDGTLVYSSETSEHFWCEHKLPCPRYETYPCPPTEGWEPVEVFEAHIRAYLPQVPAVLESNDKWVRETSGAVAGKPADAQLDKPTQLDPPAVTPPKPAARERRQAAA